MDVSLQADKAEVHIKKSLRVLPAYIQFLLDHRLEEFIALQWRLSEEAGAPMMKYFAHMSEAERIAVSIDMTREFWGDLITKGMHTQIAEWLERWRTNQLSLIASDQVVTEDITKGSYVRKQVLQYFLPGYTQDFRLYTEISSEIDYYIHENTAASFKVFISMQNEKLESTMLELQLHDQLHKQSQSITHIGNWNWTLATQRVQWSDELYRIFDIEPQSREVGFDEFLTLVHPEERELHRSRTEESLRTGGTKEYSMRIITAAGAHKVLQCKIYVSLGADGQPLQMSGTCQDITDEYKLKERLSEGSRFAEALIDTSSDLITAYDRELHLIAINKGVERECRLQREEEIGRYILDTFPHVGEGLVTDMKKVLAGDAVRYGERKHPTSGEAYEVNMVPLRNADGEIYGVLSVARNLTADNKNTLRISELSYAIQERSEQLRRSEEQFQRMISEVQDYAIISMDTDGTIRNWNAGAEKIKGYKAEEIIGRNFRLFYGEEDRKAQLPESLLSIATIEGRAVHEGWRIRKDGTKFWGSIVITALHDTDGRVVGFSKVTRDLTERKKTEEMMREKNLQLESSNEVLKRKNKELKAFNHVASHDLQEPLRKIKLFANLILEAESDVDEARRKELLERIIHASTNMQTFIDDLLTYSRAHDFTAQFEDVDLQEVFDTVRNESIIPAGNKVTITADQLPHVQGIQFQMKQLFHNLIGNAIKYSLKDKPVEIKITHEVVKGTRFKKADPDKQFHLITFHDNGIGFEQEYAAKIFEPFQRLHSKSKYEGSGVGLAICKAIVRNHHGIIYAEGKLGEGATFYVALPA